MSTHSFRHSIPEDILALSHERDLLRRRGQYDRADLIKRQIEEAGYVVKDNPRGAHLVILPGVEMHGTFYRTSRHLPSRLDEPDTCTFSVNILTRNSLEQTRNCIESLLRHSGSTSLEIILVDNASQDGTDIWTDAFEHREERLHVLRTTRMMGTAEARNIGLKQSRGQYIVLLDPGAEITGDIFTPLNSTLSHPNVGITGSHGLDTDDLRHFSESQQAEVAAVHGPCIAFKRELLRTGGLFDERYRYAQYMDIDFNFALRSQGVQAMLTPDLPISYHPLNDDLSDAERSRLSKRNFYRFLEKWGERDDLLIEA